MAKRNDEKIKDKEVEIILDGLKEDLNEVDRVSHPYFGNLKSVRMRVNRVIDAVVIKMPNHQNIWDRNFQLKYLS